MRNLIAFKIYYLRWNAFELALTKIGHTRQGFCGPKRWGWIRLWIGSCSGSVDHLPSTSLLHRFLCPCVVPRREFNATSVWSAPCSSIGRHSGFLPSASHIFQSALSRFGAQGNIFTEYYSFCAQLRFSNDCCLSIEWSTTDNACFAWITLPSNLCRSLHANCVDFFASSRLLTVHPPVQVLTTSRPIHWMNAWRCWAIEIPKRLLRTSSRPTLSARREKCESLLPSCASTFACFRSTRSQRNQFILCALAYASSFRKTY